MPTCNYEGSLIEYEDSKDAALAAHEALQAGKDPPEVALEWADRVRAVAPEVDVDMEWASPSLKGEIERLPQVKGAEINSTVLVVCMNESLVRYDFPRAGAQ